MRGIIFDLDGTLTDTVYIHVLAWQKALATAGVTAPAWQLHRRIGLAGKQLAITVCHDLGKDLSAEQAQELDQDHARIMKELSPHTTPLPGAVDLLRHLREMKVPYGIVTSGERKELEEPLKQLAVGSDTVVVCASDVEHTKPEPEPFLVCRQRLNIPPEHCFAVGDAVWDMLAARRAGVLGVGLLTGGMGEEELARAGGYRVYRDPMELDARLFELGFIS